MKLKTKTAVISNIMKSLSQYEKSKIKFSDIENFVNAEFLKLLNENKFLIEEETIILYFKQLLNNSDSKIDLILDC